MIASRAHSGWGVTAYVKTRFLDFRVQKKKKFFLFLVCMLRKFFCYSICMPNKFKRPALTAIYLLVFCGGAASILWPPVSLQKAFLIDSPLIHRSWAVLAIVGGLCGAWGVFRDRWRIERWSAPLAAGGVGGYALIVWTLTFTETFTRVTQSFFIAIAVVVFVDRAVHLAKKAKGIRVIANSTAQVARALEDRG